MNRRSLQENRPLIPDPHVSDVEHDRFWHLDVARLSPRERWAERIVLTEALASHIFYKRPERLIAAGSEMWTDRQWMSARLERLAEHQPRRKARAA